jgi:hypothetical protein
MELYSRGAFSVVGAPKNGRESNIIYGVLRHGQTFNPNHLEKEEIQNAGHGKPMLTAFVFPIIN